jgi:hypothetical protein
MKGRIRRNLTGMLELQRGRLIELMDLNNLLESQEQQGKGIPSDLMDLLEQQGGILNELLEQHERLESLEQQWLRERELQKLWEKNRNDYR